MAAIAEGPGSRFQNWATILQKRWSRNNVVDLSISKHVDPPRHLLIMLPKGPLALLGPTMVLSLATIKKLEAQMATLLHHIQLDAEVYSKSRRPH